MGRIECESHFSHPHPLTLISHADGGATNPSCCSGCKLKPSGMIYSCTICPFFLHQKCFQMPNAITHPFHNGHPLTLLATPAYAGGEFSCAASPAASTCTYSEPPRPCLWPRRATRKSLGLRSRLLTIPRASCATSAASMDRMLIKSNEMH